VSADLRHAKVHVSVMGNEEKQDLSLRGLQNASGFLQQKVGKRIDTRYTPRLKFVLDKGVKHSIEVSRILSELLPDSNDDVEHPPTDGHAAENVSQEEPAVDDPPPNADSP
jgi:ribosome-binding factor A